MGIGNSVKGKKFPPNTVYIKHLKMNSEEEAQWKLTSNSLVNVKFNIFDEEEGKVKILNKKSSVKSLILINDYLCSSPDKNKSNTDRYDRGGLKGDDRISNLTICITENSYSPIKKTKDKDDVNKLENVISLSSATNTNINGNGNCSGNGNGNGEKKKPFTEQIPTTTTTKNTSNVISTPEYKDLNMTIDTSESLSRVKNLISIFARPSVSTPSISKRNSRNIDDNTSENKFLNASFQDIPKLRQSDCSNNSNNNQDKSTSTYIENVYLSKLNDVDPLNRHKSKLIPPTHKKNMSVIYDPSQLNLINESNNGVKDNINEKEKPIPNLKSMRSSHNISNVSTTISSISKSTISTTSNTNNLLTYLKSEEYILPDKDENLSDSFCEAFFVAGLPAENAKAINESEDYLAPCRHSSCSLLPAYKPEILTRYPIKDSSRLELNSLCASLCYPLGVKICYSTDETKVKTVKNYSTAIINQDGSRYYMLTYHFYVKFDNSEFHKNYKINPVKEFLHFEKILPLYENNPALKKKLEEKLEKQLDVCTQFNFNEFVYVPYAACLISKYPYIKQMEKSIQVLVKMLVDEKDNSANINKLVLHLTREIPIPTMNKKLMFYIPDLKTSLQINAPVYKDLPILNDDIRYLLDVFSIENIITIHHLMLLEQKILFVCDQYCQLSQVIESFACLLYPMQWTHTYIPILSDEMIKYLQSFMPFIMGVDETLLNHAKQYFEEEENIYIVYIKKDLVDISSNKKGKKLKRKELIKIPDYPIELEKFITKKLTELKKVIDKCKNKKEEINNNAVEICMREVFTRSMIRMIGDYAKYATVIEDVPVFNTENFVANRPEKDASFYTELTETQLFNLFLQLDVKESFPYFYKTNEKHVSLIAAANSLTSSATSTSKGKVRSNSNTGRRSTLSKTLVDETVVNYKDLILNSQLNELSLRNFSIYSGNDNSSIINVNKNNRDNLTLLDKIIYFESAETYLIPPYFLSSIIGFVDYTEIEKMIKGGGDGQILGQENRIFKNILDFRKLDYLDRGTNCITSDKTIRVNRFVIPDLKKIKLSQILTLDGPLAVDKFVMSNNIKDKISNFELRVEQGKKNRIFFKRNQTNCEQLTYNEQEEVKILLNESLRKIFANEKLNFDQKKTLDSIFKKPFGREQFSKGFFQMKLKNSHKYVLSKTSFDDLFELFFQVLLSEGEDFNQVRLLTKATFYYYKNIGYKNNYYIYQELTNKKGTFSIWKNDKFWLNWFIADKKEVAENPKRNEEEVNFNLLLDISRIMNQLNIECKFILDCLIDEKLLKEFNLVVLKQAKNIKEMNF